MKSCIMKNFLAIGLIALSISSFAGSHKANNYDLLFAKVQSIIENMGNISEVKNLPENDKVYFKDLYIILLKSGEIVYSPSDVSAGASISSADAIVIADKTVKAWQFDESKTVYDIGKYVTSVVVTNSRDVYILATLNAHKF